MNGKIILLFVIVLAACLTQFASDIYAPSIVSISTALNTSIEQVQRSMAIYMLGVAISQLIYGPISEGVGRKGPLIIGLIIMLAGSALCWFANTIEVLILGRFIQGCGAGAAASLWRTIFRDVFSGEELAKVSSYMVILVMFIVPAAPALGGYLEEYFGWRANFIFMSGYSLAALSAIYICFKETNRHHHLDRLKLSFISTTYLTLLKDSTFMGITACTFLCYGAFFSWFVVGPVILIDVLKITPIEFGWISFWGGGLAYATAGTINGKLVGKLGISTMMRIGWSLMLLSGVCLLGNYFLLTDPSLKIVVSSLIIFYFGSTFIWPNAFATAFTPHGKIAGYAGALYGFLQLSGAATIGGLMTFLPEGDIFSLGTVIIVCTALSWGIYEKICLKNF